MDLPHAEEGCDSKFGLFVDVTACGNVNNAEMTTLSHHSFWLRCLHPILH